MFYACVYEEAEVEADDDVADDGDGGEFELAEVAGKGLSDNKDQVGCDSGEYGWSNDTP